MALTFVGSSVGVATPAAITGLKAGETTVDHRLSLLTARCIGACAIAPVVIYDGDIAGYESPQRAIERLKTYLPEA